MSGESKCFICGETYYNDSETRIIIKRVTRNRTDVKTTVWQGDVCDECLIKHFGFETGGDSE